MEAIHGIFAAYLHNTYIQEMGDDFNIAAHTQNLRHVIEEVIAHEDDVIDYVFRSATDINDVTPAQLKAFIRSRANVTLETLGMEAMFEITNTDIADWFYRGASAIKMHDFFVAGTSSYKRTWVTNNLTRLDLMEVSDENKD